MSIHTKKSQLRGTTCADAVPPASILDRLPEMSAEAKDHIKGMLHYQGSKNWQYLQVVPPGSFLENLIELFRVETDIPLELPLAAALAQMSGFLNALSVSYEIGGVEHPAKLWSVVLAPSGSGKTFASDTVARWLSDASGDPVAPHIANASSAAQFVANIQATPRGLFLRDEFGQFLSQIQNLQHMEEIKDILLRAYSGGTIDRLTKGAQIVIKDHAITVLGITVAETFERQVGADSLVDGFAQRFNYIRAQPDPSRPLTDHLIYFKRLHEGANASRFQQMRQDWLRITARNDLPDATFTFEPDAIEHLENSFRALFLEGEIPASFLPPRDVLGLSLCGALPHHRRPAWHSDRQEEHQLRRAGWSRSISTPRARCCPATGFPSWSR